MPLPHTPVSWKPVDLKAMLANARSDAEEDAQIATEKVLESQEEEIVAKFSTMSVSDKIAPGVYSNLSPPPRHSER